MERSLDDLASQLTPRDLIVADKIFRPLARGINVQSK
jgi:hypothetical protein